MTKVPSKPSTFATNLKMSRKNSNKIILILDTHATIICFIQYLI